MAQNGPYRTVPYRTVLVSVPAWSCTLPYGTVQDRGVTKVLYGRVSSILYGLLLQAACTTAVMNQTRLSSLVLIITYSRGAALVVVASK